MYFITFKDACYMCMYIDNLYEFSSTSEFSSTLGIDVIKCGTFNPQHNHQHYSAKYNFKRWFQ